MFFTCKKCGWKMTVAEDAKTIKCTICGASHTRKLKSELTNPEKNENDAQIDENDKSKISTQREELIAPLNMEKDVKIVVEKNIKKNMQERITELKSKISLSWIFLCIGDVTLGLSIYFGIKANSSIFGGTVYSLLEIVFFIVTLYIVFGKGFILLNSILELNALYTASFISDCFKEKDN